MKPALCALALVLVAAPAGATDLTPTGDEVDRYMLELHPELRQELRTTHVLGALGVGQVADQPVWLTELLGWTWWDRRHYGHASLGGVAFSPKLLGIGRDPQAPNEGSSLLLPLVEAQVGYNLVGVPDHGLGLEPLFNLDGRTYLTLGLGAAGGYAALKDSKSGIAVDLGPMLAARYKVMDWHNLNVYARYQYGLNRAADRWELAAHLSLGRNVVELGYLGGTSATYQYRDAGQNYLLGTPTPIPYGAWFVRLGEGY